MRFTRVTLLLAGLLSLSLPAHAVPIVFDFEALTEFDSVGTRLPGLSFSNATVLTAGSSLNELEFPPRSGSNVVFDDGGALSIVFDIAQFSFGGYFTYLAPVTLTAFDASHNVLGQVSSLFASNLALSGDAGSVPGELIQFASLAGIMSVRIAGDPLGGSFVLDDLTVDAESQSVPEPTTLALTAMGVAFAVVSRRPRGRPRHGQ